MEGLCRTGETPTLLIQDRGKGFRGDVGFVSLQQVLWQWCRDVPFYAKSYSLPSHNASILGGAAFKDG